MEIAFLMPLPEKQPGLLLSLLKNDANEMENGNGRSELVPYVYGNRFRRFEIHLL